MKTWVKLAVGLVLVGILVITAVYFFIYNKPHTNYETADVSYHVSVQELYQSFVEDRILADSLYTGEVLIIEGPVTRIEAFGSLVIAVFALNEGMFGEEGVRCTFLPKFNDKISQIEDGDFLKIKGYCTGYNDSDVILEHCSLIN
jgi:hypothetical protein